MRTSHKPRPFTGAKKEVQRSESKASPRVAETEKAKSRVVVTKSEVW